MLKESEVLERIGEAIDGMDMNELATLHNRLTTYQNLFGHDIEPTEGWHLIPKEGAH